MTTDKATGHKYILLEKRLDALYKNPGKGENTEFTVLERFKGQDLVGKKYVPLFDYFYEVGRPHSHDNGRRCWVLTRCTRRRWAVPCPTHPAEEGHGVPHRVGHLRDRRQRHRRCAPGAGVWRGRLPVRRECELGRRAAREH